MVRKGKEGEREGMKREWWNLLKESEDIRWDEKRKQGEGLGKRDYWYILWGEMEMKEKEIDRIKENKIWKKWQTVKNTN